jgi:hypothetical protein
MRQLLLTLVVAGAIAAASASAAGAPAAAPVPRFDCGSRNLTFLFWPQGHNAIPSISFPAYQVPHMEVYKTTAGGTYPNSSQVALIVVGPSGPGGGFATSCKKVRGKLVDSRPAKAKTTQPTILTCRFPAAPQLEWRKYTQGTIAAGLTATLKTKKRKAPLEVQAYMPAVGATLKYDPKYCKAAPPPQQ